MNFLTLCCIAKDENKRIAEWVAYHALRGVERFVVYDNGSGVPLRQTLAPLAERIGITVHDMPGPARQLEAYAHCLAAHGPQTKWLGFIDVDEFLLPRQDDDVRLLLTDFETVAGLGVNWVMFGSSGHETPPPGLQIEAFTRRAPYDFPTNHHIKSLVRPRRVTAPLSPHHFAYQSGWHCVNENGFPLPGPYGPHHNARIQLNHYFFRSRQEFSEKIERGRGDMTTDQFRHSMRDFEVQLKQFTITDTDMLCHAPAVRVVLDGDSITRDTPCPDFAFEGEKIVLLLSRGRIDLAEAMTRQHLVTYHESSAAWSLRGLVLAYADRHADAREAMATSLRIEQTVENLATLVRVHTLAGEAEEARCTARYLWWRLHGVDRELLEECAAIVAEIEPLL